MHNREDISKRLKDILVNQLNVREELITSSSSFYDDLGADSLDIVELIMAVEEEFKSELNDEIPQSHAEQFQTYGDVLEYIVSGGKTLPNSKS